MYLISLTDGEVVCKVCIAFEAGGFCIVLTVLAVEFLGLHAA